MCLVNTATILVTSLLWQKIFKLSTKKRGKINFPFFLFVFFILSVAERIGICFTFAIFLCLS